MKLALGTAQFGMAYGIANAIGRIPPDEAERILTLARVAGIDMIDTAIAYGGSESALGRIGLSGWRVVTKLPAVPAACGDIRAWVVEQTGESLNRLGVTQLHGLLLHRPEQLLGEMGDSLLAGLEEMKAHGLVRKIGVSIYGPDELGPLLERAPIDLVQAPLSVLDRRIVETGWARRLHEAGIELHTRSAFLQGLLLMPAAARPGKFHLWDDVWQRWDHWLTEVGGSALESCLQYPCSVPEVDRVVVGVDNADQLAAIVSAAASRTSGQLPDFGSVDSMLLNPSLWSQL